MSESVDVRGTARDATVVGAGLLTAALAGALVGASTAGRAALAALLLPCQVLLAVTWLAVMRAPGRFGGLAVCVGAAVAADVLVATGSTGVRRLAGVVGVAVLVAVLHQLLRRDGRADLTASIAVTLTGVAFVTAAATLVALRGGVAGTTGVQVALGAVAATLLGSRLADAVLPGPRLGRGTTHGWVGLVTGLVLAGAVGLLVGGARDVLGAAHGLQIALAVAAVALPTAIGVDLARHAGDRHEQGPLPWFPLAVLLPIATAAPVAYVTGRILLG